ncbi:MAG: glycosyltransferase family 2 protein [Lachnospiraceae bacterium]|nr:glycosyltransferase family 2 protein [Lachnospiraceae bacterium]
MEKKTPILYIVVPCYNEQEVLPITANLFKEEMNRMIKENLIDKCSKMLFINDGSKDATWDIIRKLAKEDDLFTGISQSRNRGHQNALFAGLMEAKEKCDITISIDCDGQDDIHAMEDMVKAYYDGCDVVYGVRSDRKSDTFLKKTTAQGFYRFLHLMGAEVVYNHADYRLLSAKVLQALSEFEEVNLYLRGLIPLVGFKSTAVYYSRTKRLAGESHYSFGKMLSLAFDGITSLSIRPLRLIMSLGVFFACISFLGVIWAVAAKIMDQTVAGWASMVSIICFMGSVQLICVGIMGEYIGKIYMEVKHRPRYIISERTEKHENKDK